MDTIDSFAGLTISMPLFLYLFFHFIPEASCCAFKGGWGLNDIIIYVFHIHQIMIFNIPHQCYLLWECCKNIFSMKFPLKWEVFPGQYSDIYLYWQWPIVLIKTRHFYCFYTKYHAISNLLLQILPWHYENRLKSM